VISVTRSQTASDAICVIDGFVGYVFVLLKAGVNSAGLMKNYEISS